MNVVCVLTGLWGIGVGLLLLRFVLSVRAAIKIVAKTIPLDEPAFEAMAKRLGIKRSVELRQSEVGVVPFTVGIRKPVVVLPESSRHWTVEERRAVLTHELGHVARRDVFWQFLAEFCCAVYWFHPLVWLTARQLRVEREIACDDLVVLAGEEPPVYASILLRLASGLKNRDSRRHLLGCTVAMARHHEVKQRITAILDTTLLRKPLGRIGTLLLLLIAAVGVVLASTLSPMEETEAAKAEIVDTQSMSPEIQSDEKSEDKETTVDDLFTELSGRLVDEEGNPLGKTFILLVESRENLDKLGRFIEKSSDLDEKTKEHYRSFITLQGIFTGSNEDGTFKAKTFKNGETVLIVDPVILGKKISATNTFKTTKRGDLGDLILRQGVEPVVRVLTPDGKPLSDVWVNLYPVDERGAGHRGKSDLSYGGKCAFRPMELGEYTISISKRSGRNANGRHEPSPYISSPDVRLVPFAFPEVPVTLTEESKEFTIQALETVTVMLRFQDGKNPNISRWHPDAVFSTLPEEKTGLNWKCTWEEGDSMGGGVYRFRLPKNIPLRFALPRRTSGSLYRLRMPGKSIAYPLYEIVRHPALKERNTKIQLRIHPLENDCDFDVFLVEQAEITLRAVDETGKAVENFRVYPEYLHPVLPDGTRSQSDPFAEPALSNLIDGLKRHHSSPTGVLNTPQGLLVYHYDNGTATVSRIHPDEDVRILVYDAEGRTAFIDVKLQDGERKNLSVTLKKLANESVQGTAQEKPSQAIPPQMPVGKNVTVNENPFDVKQYPVKFAEHVGKVEKEVLEKNGMALFVRVTDSNGKPARRVDYHVSSRCGDMGNFACTTTDGWFGTFNLIRPSWQAAIKSRGLPDMYKNVEFYVYTATNSPATIRLPVTPGKIYYAEVTLEKTPETELTSVSGTVLDEDDKPMENVSVHLRVVGGVGATSGWEQTNTEKDGRFTFDKVTPQPYQFALSKQGYPYTQLPEIPVNELKSEHIYRYYKNREIEIEYVYQPDGSRDFTQGDLKSRTVTLRSDFGRGFRFETGEMTNGARDIDYRQKNDVLEFAQIYFRNGNGFYDAGEVPFESVTEADDNEKAYPNVGETGYQKPRPVELGHVYVVKTTDGKYAKFVVRKITTK